ncbi:MAG: TonB family protein [Chlorobi bacterium]|nr:TonB family protein [Chlorobiota bacterium]MCI0716227.1 TonB family protein [Chlorobiota bacterium]
MVSDNIEVLQSTGYGASELKKTYQKYLQKGLIFAILIHGFIIGTYLFANYISGLEESKNKDIQQRIINITDLEPPPSATDEEEPPPPKIEEPPVAPPKDLTALTPEPVAKEKAEEQTIKTQEELEQIKAPVGNQDSGKFQFTGNVKVEEKKIEEKVVKEKVEEKSVYQSFEVEKAPECVNLAQVRASMRYPEIAREAGLEGRVTVKVLVGPDGNVIKVGSVSGPDVFHDEVRDKASDLQFTPGLQNGKPVKVWVTVPFNFKLK